MKENIPMIASLALATAMALAGGCHSSASPQGSGPATAASEKGAKAQTPQSCTASGEPSALRPFSQSGAGATIALASWEARTVAFVADVDSRAVFVVDVDTAETLSTTRLGARPGQLLALEDGRIVVTLRDRSKLAVLEVDRIEAPLSRRCETSAPADPVGVARAGDALLVTSAWGQKVARYELQELTFTRSYEVGREPRGIVASEDGQSAFVAHAVGGEATVLDLTTHGVRRISLEEHQPHDIDRLHQAVSSKVASGTPPKEALIAELASLEQQRRERKAKRRFGRTSCQGFALARSRRPGGRIFAPQVLVDPGDSSRRASGYGDENVMTEEPNVAVIDEGTGYAMPESLQAAHTGLHDEQAVHCMLPRAAAVDDASATLLVTCLGSDRVVAYDAAAPQPGRALKRSWRVAAGPTGVAVDGEAQRAAVWSQFDRTITLVPLAGPAVEEAQGDDQARLRRIELPADPKDELSVAASLGRSLFHATGDRRIARDGRACASCHPDGRDDGLVWATPNGPRRTKMLAGMLEGTAPYAWDGDNDDLRDHIRDTFERLGGAGTLRSVEVRALLAYVESLPAPPAVAAKDGAAVERGRTIFHSKAAGCGGCHSGEGLTDNELHDVETATSADREGDFNTPSLAHLAGRAPYFHDGRYATLRELLHGVDGTMGHTRHLSGEELTALEAYLASL